MLTLLQQFFRERVVVESIRLCKRKRGRRGVRQSPLRFAQAPFSQKTGQYTAQNGLSCRNCVQRFVLHCTPPRAVVYLYS